MRHSGQWQGLEQKSGSSACAEAAKAGKIDGLTRERTRIAGGLAEEEEEKNGDATRAPDRSQWPIGSGNLPLLSPTTLRALEANNFPQGRTYAIFLARRRFPIHLFRSSIFLTFEMANIAPSVLRQASRLASASTLSATTSRRGVQALSRAATAPIQRTARRTYVTETKRDSAQVSEPRIETAIRLDKKELEKAGLALSGQEGSNVAVSPMAGKLT